MPLKRLLENVKVLCVVAALKLVHRVLRVCSRVKGYAVKGVFIPFYSISSSVVLAAAKAVTHRLCSESASLCDIGTGSGFIAIELAKTCRGLYAVAIDISDKAVAVSKLNSVTHGVYDSIDIVQCYAGSCLRSRSFDLCVSNPPYLPCAENISAEACGGVGEGVYRDILLDLVRVSRRLSIVSASSLPRHTRFMDRDRRFKKLLEKKTPIDTVWVYLVPAHSALRPQRHVYVERYNREHRDQFGYSCTPRHSNQRVQM